MLPPARNRLAGVLLLLPSLLLAQDLDDLLDNPGPGDRKGDSSLLDDLIEGKDTGFPFHLVQFGAPHKPIDEKLFWRTYKGLVTASAIPDEFSIDGEPIMQTIVGQDRVLEGPLPKLKATSGSATLEKREHVLNPGRIKIRAPGGELDIDHPAVLAGDNPKEDGLRIQLAPVVFESLTEDGHAMPFHPQLICEEKPLLSKSLRFRKVTMWLPVGITYESSFGRFQLGPDGAIRYSEDDAPEDVTFTGKGFLRKHPPRHNPQSKPPTHPEFISFRRGDQTLQVYTALQKAPGKPLAIALHAPTYEAFTAKAFKPSAITCRQPAAKPRAARKSRPVSPELEAYVANRFECPPDEIAWCLLDLERPTGSTRAEFDLAGVGTVRRDILVLESGKGLHLFPHRHRTAFAPDENAPLHLFFGKGFPGGTVSLTAKPLEGKSSKAVVLAKFKFPANPGPGHDSRLLHLRTRALAPGKYDLRARMNAQWHSQPCQVTLTRPSLKSPFTAYVHDWWGNLANPGFAEQLQALESANILFLANGPRLQSSMPRPNPGLARQLAGAFGSTAPPEVLIPPTYNERLLDKLLHHRLAHIDFAPPRRDAMYNEGRSYHHSYPPDIDRLVRRLHIFSQQTADHPNAIGTTLFIDSRWQGVRAGFGTPTDMHVGKRNLALHNALGEQQLHALPAEDFHFLMRNPRSDDPDTRRRADQLRLHDLAYWHALAEESFARHNPVYMQALRQIRPDAQALLFEEAVQSSFHRPAETFTGSPASTYYANGEQNDMPMAAAFTTDWASGHAPNRPVWFTRDSEDASEGLVKDLLHAFARGLRGGGIDLPHNADPTELKRRAGFMQFLTQYGSIPRDARPHRPVTLLATSAKQRYIRNGTFQYHAAYVLLSRLGHPPAILHERILHKSGSAPGKLLVLVNEEHDLLPQTREQIHKLHAGGTRILAIGTKPRDVPVDFHLDQPLAHIFENTQDNGFGLGSHHWLWKEFAARRTQLESIFEKLKLQPRASTDPGRAYAVTLDDGPVRYVAVIADRANSHSSKFVREPRLPVSLEGQWKLVRDLRLQQDLPTRTEGGRTLVDVPLETEPCTLLALLPEAPTSPRQFRAPAKFQAYDEAGSLLAEQFASSHDAPPSGEAKVTVHELLTGRTAQAFTSPAPALGRPAAEVAPAVYLPRPLPASLPKLVLLEAGRTEIAPIARDLAAKLDARFWQLQPDDFDEHPFRWFPLPQDQARLDDIRNGQLIGFRKSLNPVLDANRRHKPHLGGYRSLNPPFMVGADCIVFSGGELGESLRSVSAWLDTPSAPGRGQARILNLYSPFQSGRNAVVLVANDLDGFTAATKALTTPATQASNPPPVPPAREAPPPELRLAGTQPVPTPFRNYSAHRHSARLLVAENGRTAIEFSEENGTAMIDADGTTLCAIKPVKHPVRLLPDGSLWSTETYGEDNARMVFRKLNTQGRVVREFEAQGCNFRPAGAKTAPTITPDGRTAIIGKPGLILFIDLENGDLRTYDDTAHIPHRYCASYPRVPVSTTFSPDGRLLLVTLDSRPPINGLSQPTFSPTFASTMLFDLAQPEQPLWVLDEGKSRRATYAAHQGFAAVAGNGTTALAGYDGEVFLIDADGQVLARQKVEGNPSLGTDREGPAGGVGTAINTDGTLAAFAFRKKLLTWHQGAFKETEFPSGLACVSIPPQGGRIHLSTDSGNVLAIAPDGAELWRLALKPDAHLANAPEGGLFAADGTGTLHHIGNDGQLLRKHSIWEDSLALTRQRRNASGLRRDPANPHYREPNTLALAREHLGATQIAQWEPTGQQKERAGKTFHHADGQITLQTGKAERTFLHLVYCKEQAEYRLPIEISGNSRQEFVLDLPTPAYRVVDLPIEGAGQTVRIPLNRSIGIAECSLWSYKHPGPNLAYQPPLTSLLDPGDRPAPRNDSLADDLLGDDLLNPARNPAPPDADDLLAPATPTTAAVEKKLRIWWPNTDPLRTQGRFLTPRVEARLMADGQRFGTGKETTPPWSNHHAPWGASLTLEFAKPQKISLVATYDRTNVQSQVSQAIQVFNGTLRNEHDSPPALGTALGNDQFWRIFPISGNRKIKTLGIHAFSGRGPDGLSEVEAYP